jgi:hypothetical protein
MPLLGVSASGTIGDSVVFGNWRGVNYARQWVRPANPRTTAQAAQRDLWAFVVSMWQRAPADAQNAFIASSRGASYTGFNLFCKRNAISLRNQTNANNIVWSPGQSGATPLATISATGGAGQITANASLGAGIPGTVVEAVIFVAFRDAAPAGPYLQQVYSLSDTSSPYSVTFASLPAGTYVVSAFTRCVEAAGKTVYSLSLNTTATVT